MNPNADIADLTFRCRPSTTLADHSKDLHVFNLLMAIDGQRSVRTIAEEDTYDLESLIANIEELLDRGLIEPVGGYSAAIPPRFMDELASELSVLIGPMAGSVIEQCASKMGHGAGNIPAAKVSTLVNVLAGYIQPKDKAEAFRTRMANRMNQG